MTRSWVHGHYRAVADPTMQEAPLVLLMDTAELLSAKWADDYVLREGVAEIINGIRALLVADWGPRLDMGTLDSALVQYGERMGYDMDRHRFTDQADGAGQ